jgi:peroxiredoxin
VSAFRHKSAGLLSGVKAAIALAIAACFVFGAAVSAAGPPFGRLEIGERPPPFSLIGSDGKAHALSDYAGRIVVLEWMSPVCNYTRAKYTSGEMQRLQREARAKDVVWLSINTANRRRAGYLTPAKAKARIAATHATVTAFLLDQDTRVGWAYGAISTPSFYIIGKNGTLAYKGAIDDDVYAQNRVTRTYVREAIEALAAGRAVTTPETRPYGCPVDYGK